MLGDYKIILVILSGIISVGQTIIYIRSFFTKETIPHHYSYLIWGTTAFISFLGQINDNSGVGSYVLLIQTICVLTTFLFSLKFRFKNPSLGDKIFLTLAFISIIPWLLFKTPLYSVIIVTFIDFCGYFPTLNKIRKIPNSEALIPWLGTTTMFVLGILSINHFSLLSSLYLFMSIGMNLITIIFILIFRKK